MTREESILHFRILEIMDLALKINGLKANKGPSPTVFVEMSGHVGILQVDMHEDGWKTGQNPTWKMTADMDRLDDLEKIAKRLFETLQEK